MCLESFISEKMDLQLWWYAYAYATVRNFMDPLEVVKKHWVAKIGVFCPLFCFQMLGKSRSYSTGTQPLRSCFWAKFDRTYCIFAIYFTKANFFGNLFHSNLCLCLQTVWHRLIDQARRPSTMTENCWFMNFSTFNTVSNTVLRNCYAALIFHPHHTALYYLCCLVMAHCRSDYQIMHGMCAC